MAEAKLVPLRKIKIGSRVDCDIFAQNGTLVFKKNNILTEPIVNRLEQMGVVLVMVELGAVELEGEIENKNVDNISDYKEDFSLKADFEQGREAILSKDIDAVHEVATSMTNTLVDSANIKKEIDALKFGTEGVVTHTLNVAVLAGAIGIENGFPKKDIELLVVGGMLHDMGKLYIAPEILNKQGRLTDEEFAIMKSHTTEGYHRLLENKGLDPKIPEIAYQHHENNDGTGYPRGLSGDKILFESRIIHVVDVYEAMTARRCYKDPMLPGDVMEFVMGRYATMFDPGAMDLFLKTIPAYKRGDLVKLSDGSRCRVLESNKLNSLRPIVINLDTGKIYDLYREKEYFSLTITEMLFDGKEQIKHDAGQF
ncbi:MAG: HD-GYP domain-containing protein [Lachnospiraceae bacterium]|nr:HD-GYP domain-containing protein [Lachnospiraceae bacterium]